MGSAGVTALPMASLHSSLGPAYMSASLLLASAMEAIFGILRLSKFADVITTPVIAGFLNALAIFIGKSQVKVFKDAGHWLTGSPLTSSLSLAALTASLIFSLVPYRSIIKVPPQLIAITVSTLLAQFLHLPVKLLGEQAGKGALVGGLSALPKINGLPNVPFNLHTLQLIGSTAVGVALVCIVETLLAQRIKPDQSKDNSDRAMVGLGVGSLLSALIGGFGGCGLIPNTLLNIGSGGRGNLSSLTYAITMALSVIFCSKVLTAIPMAVLAGLMMTVAYNTMEWNESYHFLKETFHSTQAFLDSLAMVVTTFLSFAVDMGLGILVGTLIANLQRIYQSITRKTASK
ncbi:SulP family inorganic anion transporter [archaeon]|nr:MAG: SulP family inorganic anion transporter [archaeon]